MNPVTYVKRLRIVALGSWGVSLVVFLVLARSGIIAFDEFLPLFALLAGSIPIVVFMIVNKPVCGSCGGPMRVSSGFPRIVYRCRDCGTQVDTGIDSD